MAFDKTHLSAMGHGDGQTWWQYKSADDNRLTIEGATYFDAASGMLAVDDLIYVIAADAVGFMAVTANDGTTVTVSDGAV